MSRVGTRQVRGGILEYMQIIEMNMRYEIYNEICGRADYEARDHK